MLESELGSQSDLDCTIATIPVTFVNAPTQLFSVFHTWYLRVVIILATLLALTETLAVFFTMGTFQLCCELTRTALGITFVPTLVELLHVLMLVILTITTLLSASVVVWAAVRTLTAGLRKQLSGLLEHCFINASCGSVFASVPSIFMEFLRIVV